jgi:SecD/SecF fusion protein
MFLIKIWTLRHVVRSTFLLALIVGIMAALSGYGAGEEAEADCSVTPQGPSLELLYRLEAGEEPVSASTRDEAVAIACERLRVIGGGEGEIRPLAKKRVRVLLPRTGDVAASDRVVDQIGVAGQLYFYDWEPNLIGPERIVGGNPGTEPPVYATRRAKREWSAAGRNPNRPANSGLILAGAFPTVYGAVKLASEQKPRVRCAACSASSPRFYMFDRSTAHQLIAGPATTRSDLRGDAAHQPNRHNGIVLKVPVGTVIVSEQPIGRLGAPIASAEPGWYALKDRFALSGDNITDPKQEFDLYHQPNVTFGFTEKGRVAFQQLTRVVAFRGQARAIGPVGSGAAEMLSGHIALVVDGEIKTRPIINFAQNPDGIDGRVGAQISGGFGGVQEARDLVAILKIGALPVNMTLIHRALR